MLTVSYTFKTFIQNGDTTTTTATIRSLYTITIVRGLLLPSLIYPPKTGSEKGKSIQ